MARVLRSVNHSEATARNGIFFEGRAIYTDAALIKVNTMSRVNAPSYEPLESRIFEMTTGPTPAPRIEKKFIAPKTVPKLARP